MERCLDAAGLPGLAQGPDGGLVWNNFFFKGDLSALCGVPLSELTLPPIRSLDVVRGMSLKRLRMPWPHVADVCDLRACRSSSWT